MVKVKPLGEGGLDAIKNGEAMLALTARGKTGPGAGFGFIRYGHSRFGSGNPFGGIYQKRVTGYNQYGRSATRPRRAYYVRMRYYRTPNPRTPVQQANRQKMADAVQAWKDLTLVEKSRYNAQAKRHNKIGRALFISWHMKNH